MTDTLAPHFPGHECGFRTEAREGQLTASSAARAVAVTGLPSPLDVASGGQRGAPSAPPERAAGLPSRLWPREALVRSVTTQGRVRRSQAKS